MGDVFEKPKKVKISPPPALPDDSEAQAAAEAELEERRRKRKGRGGTILTSAMGVKEEASILSKKLLGG